MKNKQIRIGSLLMTLFLVSILFVSTVSAEGMNLDDSELKAAKSFDTNKSSVSGFVQYSESTDSAIYARSGVTYDLDVTITGVKDYGTYWYNLYGDSSATASEDIDYIQASGTLMGPQFTANYGPSSNYNADSAIASGSLTDYFFWYTTYYNNGHGMYRINGVNYYLDATATITP